MSARAGVLGGSAGASYDLKIRFLDPQELGYDTVGFEPSPECLEQLLRFGERHDLSQAYLAQEVLTAKISGCEEISVEGSVSLPGGGGEASVEQACTLMSDYPVTVGVKQVPLSEFPELAALFPQPVPDAGGAVASPAPARPQRRSPPPAPRPRPRPPRPCWTWCASSPGPS